jgi:hypothetical protein
MNQAKLHISENDLVNLFDEYLDETQEKVNVIGLEYLPSTILKTVDPIAYRVNISDFYDSIRDDYLCEDFE